jgi:GNAT superfamily N-acetyltransferase
MAFVTVTNPEHLGQLRDFITGASGEKKEDYLEMLKSLMRYDPDYTLVLTGFDGHEPVCLAVLHAPEHAEYAWVFETFISPKHPEFGSSLVNKMLDWAKSKGKKSLRAQTERSAKAFERKWGFKEVAIVVERTVEDSILPRSTEELTPAFFRRANSWQVAEQNQSQL